LANLTQLKRRLARLEALVPASADGSGLVPHTHAWLMYWLDQWRRLSRTPRDPTARMTLEAYRALAAEARRLLALVSGVNYFFGSTTTISPGRRQL